MLEIAVPDRLTGFAVEGGVAVVLGSGFGGLVDAVRDPVTVPYSEIEGYPVRAAALPGHADQLVVGHVAGTPVVAFAGRPHRYQGITAQEAAYPALLARALGCRVLVVTNAAGGVNPEVGAGDIVLISDHINLAGDSPLVGWQGPDGGVPFVSMRDAYDPGLRATARAAADEQGIQLVDGVYAGVLGPEYETPAEVRYLRSIGADVVGMSTVPEVIAARALGLRVLGFSLCTNAAAGHGLSHDEVIAAGERAQLALTRLLVALLHRL